ncbi:MAG: vitamin K epoxide reductase family protein [Patescibacteria group bacterium UBA2163]
MQNTLRNLRRFAFPTLLIFSVLGIINAGYLTLTAFAGVSPTCNFLHGCAEVASSPYSKVFGIPLALFGVFFYSIVAGFSLWGMIDNKAPVYNFILVLTVLGFILSLYFLYLQAFIIQAFCEYCLFSLFDATVLLLTTLFFLPKKSSPIKQKLSNNI